MKVLLITFMRCAECGADLFLHSEGRNEKGELRWMIEHSKSEYCSQFGTKLVEQDQLEPREI